MSDVKSPKGQREPSPETRQLTRELIVGPVGAVIYREPKWWGHCICCAVEVQERL